MAQDFNYIDASGVNYTFEPTTRAGVDIVKLKTFTLPSSVTKWVMPETVINNGTTYRFTDITAYAWDEYNLRSATLLEIVFPNSMTHAGGKVSAVTFPKLHKVTFGINVSSAFTDFVSVPLDTIIFLGTGIIWNDGYDGTELYNAFDGCPSTTKIFIPCGTKQQFLTAFASQYTTWDEENGWTIANFVEAPCLNTLTVLSSDVNLGGARSYSSGSIITSTPANTSAQYSGQAELIAIPKADNVFVGWNDGNLENPRVINVTSNITHTAQFAACTNTAIESISPQASGLSAYPNPVENMLNVELNRDVRNGTLALFDLNGKAVARQTLTGRQAAINLQPLAKGMYILRLVEGGNASAGVKIVKQ
ncbi:T9SS C-terminal target domain-containing protein [Bacteroidia bacterium]|nr:T9SS C-terminal target domain-containing protein [Bacteroidia bacterium]